MKAWTSLTDTSVVKTYREVPALKNDADRAFVRRAVHPQNPRAVVLVANTGAFPSATAAITGWAEAVRYWPAIRYGASVESFSHVSSNSRSGSDASMMPAPARSQVLPSHS
jgi:hypothetical protein